MNPNRIPLINQGNHGPQSSLYILRCSHFLKMFLGKIGFRYFSLDRPSVCYLHFFALHSIERRLFIAASHSCISAVCWCVDRQMRSGKRIAFSRVIHFVFFSEKLCWSDIICDKKYKRDSHVLVPGYNCDMCQDPLHSIIQVWDQWHVLSQESGCYIFPGQLTSRSTGTGSPSHTAQISRAGETK